MSKVELHLAALAAAGAGIGFVAEQADAAVVYSGIQNLNVPATFDGLYLNMVTGATGSLGSGVPGWDIDPWVSGGTWRILANGGNTGGVVGVGTAATNLPVGTPIGAASAFLTAAATSAPTGNNVIMGIRFVNEGTGQQHYGWVRMSNVVNPATAPATIVDWAYESVAGANINAGDGIPTPGAASLLAIGAAGLVGRRRRA